MKGKIYSILALIVVIASCEPGKNSRSETNTTPAEETPASVEITDEQTDMSTTVPAQPVDSPVFVPPARPDTATTTDRKPAPAGLKNMVVSFISIGEGTDYKTAESLSTLLDQWTARTENRLRVDKVGWGREGETDFCIDFTNMEPQETTDLASEVQSLVQGKELVQLKRDEPCKTSR